MALPGTVRCSPPLPPFSLLESGFLLDGPSDCFCFQAVSQKVRLRHLVALSPQEKKSMIEICRGAKMESVQDLFGMFNSNENGVYHVQLTFVNQNQKPSI